MKCAILQPSYIPWRGYFHQIAKVDLFIFYDDVQYDKRSWRNRNRIKTLAGTQWLTIPVHSKGAQTEHILINKIDIDWTHKWTQEHLKAIHQSYFKAPFYEPCSTILQEHLNRKSELLVDLTIPLTIAISRELGITDTTFARSSEMGAQGEKTDRLIDILKKVGADHYISGPSAKAYIEDDKFIEAGITLEYMDYRYAEYQQFFPPFDGQVTILDLLFMTGPEALRYIVS